MRKPRTRYWAEWVDGYRVLAAHAVRDYGDGFVGAVWLLIPAADLRDTTRTAEFEAKLDAMLHVRERLISNIVYSHRWPSRMSERFDWVNRPNGEPNPLEVRPEIAAMAERSSVPWTWIYWEEPT